MEIFNNFCRSLKNYYRLKLLLSWITPVWITNKNKMLSGVCRKAAESLETWVESSETQTASGDQELVQWKALWAHKNQHKNSKRMIKTKKKGENFMPSMEEGMATRNKQLLVPPTTLPLHPQKILVALIDVALPLEKGHWFTFASTILFIKKKNPLEDTPKALSASHSEYLQAFEKHLNQNCNISR